MKKRSILLFTVTVAVLFAITEAMAQECNLVQISGSNPRIPTAYKIAFVGTIPCTPQNPCADQGGVSHTTGAKWNYRVTSSPGSITQLSVLTPVCSPDLGVFVLSGGQVLPPGLGESTTMFGVGDYQEQVARLALNASPDFYLGVSRDVAIANTSMQIRVSKNLYYCPSIPGPECGLPAYVPVSRTSCVTIEDENVCFDFAADGCPIRIYNGDTNIDYPSDPADSTITVSDCGDIFGNQNPNCRMCIRRVDQTGSGGCSNCVVAGRSTRIPTGCCNDALPCPRRQTCGTDGLCH